MSDQQRCIQCTWDGAKLVKMCSSHQRIDDLETKLAAAEAERDDANRRFNEMNTPTGREIELAHDLAECRRLLREFGNAEIALAESEDGIGCDDLINEHVRTYEAIKREAARAAGGQ